eukprot:CAMPEP_0196801386 /NCGR_PEP_ID=MMETSP1362-20130617/1136_1 /TAXON_ID=163516 /ORGANISM="Leptocylindrus danicus, Strain CCMP1856" /LENGTH=150 /DNA_ID=CAMNT_0042172315 /DNA_START=153 /DNA_END=605 /DNA_ORIENTATION=-
MMPESLHSASTYLATVSADIDNISTDNFKEVFTGGLVVMCGGIASSLITGLLLDMSGKYDEAVANDALGDGEEDYNVPDRSEWTEEQAAEFDELAEKFIAGKVSPSGEELVEWMRQFKRDGSVTKPIAASTAASITEKDKALSMFSDYDD